MALDDLTPDAVALPMPSATSCRKPRCIACSRPHLITSPAFIVMKAADEFKDKTTAPDQLWQTDSLQVTGWWFYLSTVLTTSRYIVAWKLCTTMKAEDVTATLELALQASGLDQITYRSSLSKRAEHVREWRQAEDAHIRGAQSDDTGEIALASDARDLLENIARQLEARIEAFVAHYNHLRYHESIDNLTPADVYFGRGQTILLDRERIKLTKPSNSARRLLQQNYGVRQSTSAVVR